MTWLFVSYNSVLPCNKTGNYMKIYTNGTFNLFCYNDIELRLKNGPIHVLFVSSCFSSLNGGHKS